MVVDRHLVANRVTKNGGGRKQNYFYGNTIFFGSLHTYRVYTGNINIAAEWGRVLNARWARELVFDYSPPKLCPIFTPCVYAFSYAFRDQRLNVSRGETRIGAILFLSFSISSRLKTVIMRIYFIKRYLRVE